MPPASVSITSPLLSKEEFIDIINKILNNDTSFIIENRNLSCSIDGKCEIKK